MMAGGYYNHYDDPDEFWDEQPLEPKPKNSPAVPTPHHSLSPPASLSPAPPASPARAITPHRPFNPPPPVAPAGPDPSSTSSLRESPFSAPRAAPPQTPDSGGFDKLLNDLAQFHGYTQAISGLMQEVFSAGPSYATGRDNTGTVEVTISGANELIDIVISDNWSRHLDARQIGSAVLDAIQDAQIRRFETAMTVAMENGIMDRLEALSVDNVARTHFEPPAIPRYPTIGVSQLIEETFQALNSESAAQPREFVGEVEIDGEMPAWVTLNRSGIVNCGVDSLWAGRVDGNTIAWGLKASYDKARQWIQATNKSDRGADVFGALASDAMQTLAAMQNLI
ncbi:YbaB/EbfC family nucleoid-associated protein [Nocardia sp. NPDC049707]|uniref:YbaB/EbfC family nucleoid-associated protein n=1 Tax=Nocardia sp. NPDC049707 TaxID=3154735 RepID=UPI003441E9E6